MSTQARPSASERGADGDSGVSEPVSAASGSASLPHLDETGALRTTFAHPALSAPLTASARTVQEHARQHVDKVIASMADLAATMHRQARALEPFVEGQLSADLADPRNSLLAHSLALARDADLRVSTIAQQLSRLRGALASAGEHVSTLELERIRLAMLYSNAQELNSTDELDALLTRVLDRLIEVAHAERGFLMLWDEQAEQLTFTVARGADKQPLAERDFQVSRGILTSVWNERRALLTTDATDDPRFREHASIVAYNIRSVMCAPLLVRGHGVGVVYVDSRTDVALFSPADLDLLAAFCNQAAIAIDNARLIADLRQRLREIGEMKSYMESIFASIASGVVAADTEGRITTFNRAAERILGLSACEVTGQPYTTALAALSDARLMESVRLALEGEELTTGYEVSPVLPQRGAVHLRLSIAPLRSRTAPHEMLGMAMVIDDLTELRRSQRQAEEIQRLFGQYVHPAVVRQLLADPSAVHLGGETREISILFADIRGFTQLAEQLPPQQLVHLLNQNLELLTEAIWCEEGTLTMFIGDALMAIFNAPLPQPDHALRAVRAAWAMRAALERSANTAEGGVRAQYGIGVHTGLAVVGNIGARGRMQNYTAIGDAVNLAQRLQAAAAANQILLSPEVYAAVADSVSARMLDPLLVKGKSAPLSVFELEGMRTAPAGRA